MRKGRNPLPSIREVKMSLNNEVRLIGNVVKDPEVFDSEKGKFGKVRIAANTKSGEREDTLFINVKLFGYAFKDFEYHDIEKGDKVLAYGRLAIEEYTDKNEVNRKEPVIYANSIIKIARKQKLENNF
jgi:single-stranded DNA-binding protein